MARAIRSAISRSGGSAKNDHIRAEIGNQVVGKRGVAFRQPAFCGAVSGARRQRHARRAGSRSGRQQRLLGGSPRILRNVAAKCARYRPLAIPQAIRPAAAIRDSSSSRALGFPPRAARGSRASAASHARPAHSRSAPARPPARRSTQHRTHSGSSMATSNFSLRSSAASRSRPQKPRCRPSRSYSIRRST